MNAPDDSFPTTAMPHDTPPDTPRPTPRLPLPEGSLQGLRVIDLSRVLAGPYCTQILADHGADVLKIEPPMGDETRGWGPPFDAQGTASYFHGLNRNKRGSTMDLTDPAQREALLAMLADADVLVENFKTGTMEKWGLGPQTLTARFPRLVYARITGFGADGPLGGLPGYDAILQAMTGLMSINGDPTTGPMRMGTPIVDLATGLYSVIAISMALYERTVSGRGQYLDMTLHDCGMALLHPQAANYFLNGKRPMPMGNPHPNLAPYEKYKTATCEIFIASGNDGQFRKMCEALGRPEMATDPRFIKNADRLANRAAMIELFQAALADKDGHSFCLELLNMGLPAGPVLPVDESMVAPHTEARQMVTELDGYRGLGTPIKMSRTPGGTRAKPPSFGQHGEEVLTQFGYSAEEIEKLKAEGILHTTRKK